MSEPIMTALSYGAGVNSTALLVGMAERIRTGEKLDLDMILFADTGGERPETYAYIETVNAWLQQHSWQLWPMVYPALQIQVVQVKGTTLEADSLKRNALPALAYGFRTCSQRFKIEPQERVLRRELNRWWDRYGPHGSGGLYSRKILKLVGIDYDEIHRARYNEEEDFETRYPLIEWKWGRKECIAAIERAGLPLPPKSSCFFCPAMKRREILDLKRTHPDLYDRAVAMERNASRNTKVIGLGRHFRWSDIEETEAEQTEMEVLCGCYDGPSI